MRGEATWLDCDHFGLGNLLSHEGFPAEPCARLVADGIVRPYPAEQED